MPGLGRCLWQLGIGHTHCLSVSPFLAAGIEQSITLPGSAVNRELFQQMQMAGSNLQCHTPALLTTHLCTAWSYSFLCSGSAYILEGKLTSL